jgi:hypothetical protein
VENTGLDLLCRISSSIVRLRCGTMSHAESCACADAHHVAWTVVDTPSPKIAYGEVRLFKYELADQGADA